MGEIDFLDEAFHRLQQRILRVLVVNFDLKLKGVKGCEFSRLGVKAEWSRFTLLIVDWHIHCSALEDRLPGGGMVEHQIGGGSGICDYAFELAVRVSFPLKGACCLWVSQRKLKLACVVCVGVHRDRLNVFVTAIKVHVQLKQWDIGLGGRRVGYEDFVLSSLDVAVVEHHTHEKDSGVRD